MNTIHSSARARRLAWLAGSVLLALLAFLGDWLSGAEISFSAFYLIAIAVATWFAGRAAGRMPGVEWLRGVLRDARALEPEALRDRLVAEIRRHVGGAPPSDDVTLIVLGFDGQGAMRASRSIHDVA